MSHRIKTRPRLVAAAIAAAAALALSACSSNPAPAGSGGGGDGSAAAPTTIRIAMTASATNLAMWVADEQGFFKDHNVDAQINIITSPSLAKVPQVLGRQYDVSQITGPQHISAANAGLPIVAISGGYIVEVGNPNTVMMVPKDSPIKTAKDLVGKRIVVPTISGNTNTAAMYWLSQEGVDPKSVELVEASSTNMADLLNTKQVDAGEITSPFVGLLTAQGYRTIGLFLDSVAELNSEKHTHMSYYGADKTWAKNNEAGLKNLRAALDDASAWIKANESAAIDLLMKETKVPAENKEFVTIPTYTTKLTTEDLDAWVTAMGVVNDFKTNLKMADLIDIP